MTDSVALIVAAGRGTRAAGTDPVPKQYAVLGGATMLARSVAAFASHPAIDAVQVVIHVDDTALYRVAMPQSSTKLRPPVAGGASRQASVRNGLEALAALAPNRVLIHDAARPLVDASTIDRVLGALDRHQGAIAALPLADTVKRATVDGTVAETLDRRGLWRAQTPQGFGFAAILDAHRRAAAAATSEFTDDASIAEWAGIEVALVEGDARNFKVTTREDLAMAEQLVTAAEKRRFTVVGQGFDVHRFKAGDHVRLGGVRIPHEAALEGHSDADVVLHALTDALLGAIGDGDIGQHFPPSDARWRGAASTLFLADAVRRVRETGGRIENADVTVLCEAPRIGPHRAAMAAHIAATLGISAARVGVKATTTERLGFTGRREGIAAMAIVSVSLPEV